MDEFESAKTSFEAAAALDPKLKACKSWLAKCELKGVCSLSLTHTDST